MAKAHRTHTPPAGSIARRDLRNPALATLALLALLDLTVPHHGYFGIDGTLGFAVWFGAAACFALIMLALAVGSLLRTSEGTYDD